MYDAKFFLRIGPLRARVGVGIEVRWFRRVGDLGEDEV